jgi:hypothetical protein
MEQSCWLQLARKARHLLDVDKSQSLNPVQVNKSTRTSSGPISQAKFCCRFTGGPQKRFQPGKRRLITGLDPV